jgi:hypothetical protein
MIQPDGLTSYRGMPRYWASLTLFLFLFVAPGPGGAQSSVPKDQFHVSVAFGGYFLVGVGYTRWVEEHHALEFTVFPFARPGEGFPFAIRAGYAWVPSDEIWRAKLGGNLAALISPSDSGRDRITPILSFTPGILYDPTINSSLRTDLWMSYYLTQKVFAPSGIEFMYAWGR